MTVSARSVYALRIAAPQEERDNALIKSVGVALVGLVVGEWWGDVIPANVVVHIVDVRSGRVVFELREDAAAAHTHATEIADDLDRLDVAAFEEEWGIHSPTSASD